MKPKKTRLPVSITTRVVGDGSIAGPARDGVNIPVIVVDGTSLPAIGEAIEAARYEPAGDVRTAWLEDRRTGNQLLHVVLVRPVPVEFVIVFEMPEKGVLVDGITEARGFYLKTGKPTDNFKSTFENPSLLVDVPESEFGARWPLIFQRSLMESFRRKGLGYRQARDAAKHTYDDIRKVTTLRIPPRGPGES